MSKAAWRSSDATRTTENPAGSPGHRRRERAGGQDKRAKLDSLVHYDSGIASLSIASVTTRRNSIPTGPPRHPGNQCQQDQPAERPRSRTRYRDDGAADRAAARRLFRLLLSVPGKPWRMRCRNGFEHRGSDGFTVNFPYLPGGLDKVCEKVVPELQRRGIFRTEYEGNTLREHLGLPRPENQFFRGARPGPVPMTNAPPGAVVKPFRRRFPRNEPRWAHTPFSILVTN